MLDADGRPVARTAGRDLAGQRRRALPPRGATSTPAPLDPNFPGAGRCLTDDDGRLPLPDRQARRLSRGRTTPTPGGRPTSTSRSSGARSPSGWSRRCTSPATRCSRSTRSSTPSATSGARAPDRALRPRRSPSRSGRSATASTSCCAGREATPLERADDELSALGLTPSQTVGPFFDIGLLRDADRCALVDAGTPGADPDRGPLLDGDGAPGPGRAWSRSGRRTPRAATPTRQTPRRAAARGRFPRLRPLGTTTTGTSGSRRQARPGAVAGRRAAGAAPRVSVFARGLLKHVVTRMYFPDEAEANAADPVLAATRRRAAPLADRSRRREPAYSSTSCCRERDRPHSLRVSAFGALFVPRRLRDAVSGDAWVAGHARRPRRRSRGRAHEPASCRPRLRRRSRRLRCRRVRRRRALATRGRRPGPGRAARARAACRRRRRGGAVRPLGRDEPGRHRHRRDARRAPRARAASMPSSVASPRLRAPAQRTAHADGRPHAPAAGACRRPSA